jgi:3,4-dihydroxy 2-butanone 4-phosphate synthase/GTP cyclohydrolase II
VTPALIAQFVRHTSGLLCVAMEGERLDALRIPLMPAHDTEPDRTAFAVSVDYRHGTTTGISAADRAATIAALGDPTAAATDFQRPGHVLPLRYRPGGVLRRPRHTEATVDLVRLAGLPAVGVLCEVVDPDGAMARRPQLRALADAEGLVVITIQDLIEYRWQRDRLVERVATATLPTSHGVFTAHCYRSSVDGTEHLALVMGDLAQVRGVLVRVHSECLTGEALGSLRCDCGDQLDAAMRQIGADGHGVVVYLRGHEGRGIGLGNTMQSYEPQANGYDSVDSSLELCLPADGRTCGVARQILRDLQLRRALLLTNNPHKCAELDSFLPGGGHPGAAAWQAPHRESPPPKGQGTQTRPSAGRGVSQVNPYS